MDGYNDHKLLWGYHYMVFGIRTDLAREAAELCEGSLPEGVEMWEEERGGIRREIVEVRTEAAAQALSKPRGRYVSLSLESLDRREEDAFLRSAAALSEELGALLDLRDGDGVLVAALGNRAITPDALGEYAAENVLVTKHLKELLPEEFRAFRPVTLLRCGVLGTTGLESAALVSAAAEISHCRAVIAVDALCARSTDRLCKTVQLTDAGIVPGSGVGKARTELSEATAGRPVAAIGLPTVVDAATLCADLCGSAPENTAPLFVTPRDIDTQVHSAGRLIGYAVNLALHPGLTVSDVDMLLG